MVMAGQGSESAGDSGAPSAPGMRHVRSCAVRRLEACSSRVGECREARMDLRGHGSESEQGRAGRFGLRSPNRSATAGVMHRLEPGQGPHPQMSLPRGHLVSEQLGLANSLSHRLVIPRSPDGQTCLAGCLNHLSVPVACLDLPTADFRPLAVTACRRVKLSGTTPCMPRVKRLKNPKCKIRRPHDSCCQLGSAHTKAPQQDICLAKPC
jgi:hypothetical protein